MRVAYFDCARGISGVASLAALLDAGADADALAADLAFLAADAPVLRTEDVMLGPFRVRSVSVPGGEASRARGLRDVEHVIRDGELPDRARDLALLIYGRLAEAEARVHGSSPDAVTFHELGSLRSIVGVVGTALALERLGIDTLVVSPLPLGRGTVDTAHGRLALPAPATLELLRGVPVDPEDSPGELVTPTGAAIVAVAAASFGPIPAMTIESVGYGTGDTGDTGDTGEPLPPGPVVRAVIGQSR